jgi:hypothetical protein
LSIIPIAGFRSAATAPNSLIAPSIRSAKSIGNYPVDVPRASGSIEPHCERNIAPLLAQDGIEVISLDPTDQLAERLYLEIRRARAVSDLEWISLDEGEREFYRTCVEGLLLDWKLVMRVHENQIAPVTARGDPR